MGNGDRRHGPRAALLSWLLGGGLLGLPGCTSTTDLPASPADVKLEIELEHSTERRPDSAADFEIKRIEAVLRDRKNKAIENTRVALLVNEVPLRLSVGTGNYYDRYPRYTLDAGGRLSLKADTTYRFALRWADGTRYEAASIRTPGPLSMAQFTVPRTHPRDRSLSLLWRKINEPAELTVYRQSVGMHDHAGNAGFEAGTSREKDALRCRLGRGLFRSRTGSLVVPASFFTDSRGRRVSTVGVEVSARTEGSVSGPFLPQSFVRAVRKLAWGAELIESAPARAKGQ